MLLRFSLLTLAIMVTISSCKRSEPSVTQTQQIAQSQPTVQAHSDVAAASYLREIDKKMVGVFELINAMNHASTTMEMGFEEKLAAGLEISDNEIQDARVKYQEWEKNYEAVEEHLKELSAQLIQESLNAEQLELENSSIKDEIKIKIKNYEILLNQCQTQALQIENQRIKIEVLTSELEKNTIAFAEQRVVHVFLQTNDKFKQLKKRGYLREQNRFGELYDDLFLTELAIGNEEFLNYNSLAYDVDTRLIIIASEKKPVIRSQHRFLKDFFSLDRISNNEWNLHIINDRFWDTSKILLVQIY